MKQAALFIEGDLEERIGDLEGTFQEGRIDIFTGGDVEKWQQEWRIMGE